MTQEQSFELRLDYEKSSDRDHQTYCFEIDELPEENRTPIYGIPPNPKLGVHYEWVEGRGGNKLRIVVKAPHTAPENSEKPRNRVLSVSISASVLFSFLSSALEGGTVSIGKEEAGKLLVAIGNALQEQGEAR
jgi:hypothetical protein